MMHSEFYGVITLFLIFSMSLHSEKRKKKDTNTVQLSHTSYSISNAYRSSVAAKVPVESKDRFLRVPHKSKKKKPRLTSGSMPEYSNKEEMIFLGGIKFIHI